MQTEPEIIMRFMIHEVWGFDFDLEFDSNSCCILRPREKENEGFLVEYIIVTSGCPWRIWS